MDYSPSPRRVKPQYDFLDNSIEVGRSEKPFRSSPLKNVSLAANVGSDGIQDMKKKFYNKYSDLKPRDFNSMKPSKTASNDTTDRVFRDLGAKVPLDDDVKINSNMVEKIIKENKKLKDDKDLLQSYAQGCKEKLLKYKLLSDELKKELSDVQKEAHDHQKSAEEWKSKYEEAQLNYKELQLKHESLEAKNGAMKSKYEALKSSNTKEPSRVGKDQEPPKSPVFNFNSNNTEDIFANLLSSHDMSNQQGPNQIDPGLQKVESIIGEHIGSIKKDIETLKTLMSQMKSPQAASTVASEPVDTTPPAPVESEPAVEPKLVKEDEWIVKETFELNELQNEVKRLYNKLNMREENLRKKNDLKRQLLELSSLLERADEAPPKKTRSSPIGSPLKENQSLNQKVTPTDDDACTKNIVDDSHDIHCQRCRKARETAHNSQDNHTDEPAHFHIDGVKWYV